TRRISRSWCPLDFQRRGRGPHRGEIRAISRGANRDHRVEEQDASREARRPSVDDGSATRKGGASAFRVPQRGIREVARRAKASRGNTEITMTGGRLPSKAYFVALSRSVPWLRTERAALIKIIRGG